MNLVPARSTLLRVAPLVGLGVSSLLLVDYLRPVPVFCGEGGCATVRFSRYAHLLGLPTPAFGLGFFAVALVLALVTHPRARTLLLAAAGAGGLAALGFVGLQLFELHAICKYCMIADGTALLLLLVAASGLKDTPTVDRATQAGFGVLAALVVAIPFVLPLLGDQKPTVELVDRPLPEVIAREQQPGVATVVEFVDFECPYCRRLHHDLSLVLRDFGEHVRVVRKHNPLGMHPHARTAARAACCAEEQGRADAMADALFQLDPDKLTDEGCAELAASLKLDAERYAECMKSSRPDVRLAADAKDVEAAEVGQQAPVFWIGKVRFLGAQPPAVLRAGILRALSQAGS